MSRVVVVGVAALALSLLGMDCDREECDPQGASCPERVVAAGPYWLCDTGECPDAQLCLKLGDDGVPTCVSRCIDQMYCEDTSLECHGVGAERLCVSETFASGSDYVE